MDKKMITIHTEINAPVEKVWELYTAPEHIVKGNQASDDWHTTKAENDVRVGGKFSSRMEAKDGSTGFDVKGTYVKRYDLHGRTQAQQRKYRDNLNDIPPEILETSTTPNI